MFMNNRNLGNKQLSDWALIPLVNGGLGSFCLKGAIYNDDRFKKGSYIATSALNDIKMTGNDIFFITGSGSVYQCNVHEINPNTLKQTLHNIHDFAYSQNQKLLNQAQMANSEIKNEFINQASSLENNIDKLTTAISNFINPYTQTADDIERCH
mgnify:CR=1 FL=1